MATTYYTFDNIGSGVRAVLTANSGLYVDSGVTLGSTDDYGVEGTGVSLRLSIYGTVAGNSGGVSLSSGSGVLRVYDSGALTSATSSSEALLIGGGATYQVYNDGSILGETGVRFEGAVDARIVNRGTIEGIESGIVSEASTTVTSSISVLNYGEINVLRSIPAIAFGGQEENVVFNDGRINGYIYLGAGDDTYVGTTAKPIDEGLLKYLLASQNSPLSVSSYVFGGDGVDTFIGGKATDLFQGEADADVLNGGAGKDYLTGGLDKDSLSGGDGADVFTISEVEDSTLSNPDRILDFSLKQKDQLAFSSSVDANTLLGGSQDFDFIGSTKFSGDAGELRFRYKGDLTYLEGNIDADKTAEFRVIFEGKIAFTEDSFLL
ncbi:M10 family metallopeptidase C-terminal domain-containing protein [Rhizobium sp. FKL33]|uniref:calcium-binding protein n=1 Tax=Rhizobium sp. FKL33 TaxID=2562307 RepID=UPI0010C0B580|nr:M10 family metallopeptidase C-terminal domain-containing protein [Rhizobium sp. FKL33]